MSSLHVNLLLIELLQILHKREGKEIRFSEISPMARQVAPLHGVLWALPRKFIHFFFLSLLSIMNWFTDIEFAYNHLQLCTLSIFKERKYKMIWKNPGNVSIKNKTKHYSFQTWSLTRRKAFAENARTQKHKPALKWEAVLVKKHRKGSPLWRFCIWVCNIDMQVWFPLQRRNVTLWRFWNSKPENRGQGESLESEQKCQGMLYEC